MKLERVISELRQFPGNSYVTFIYNKHDQYLGMYEISMLVDNNSESVNESYISVCYTGGKFFTYEGEEGYYPLNDIKSSIQDFSFINRNTLPQSSSEVPEYLAHDLFPSLPNPDSIATYAEKKEFIRAFENEFFSFQSSLKRKDRVMNHRKIKIGDTFHFKLDDEKLLLSEQNYFLAKNIFVLLPDEVRLIRFRPHYHWIYVEVDNIEDETISFKINKFIPYGRFKLSTERFDIDDYNKMILYSNNESNHILAFAEKESTPRRLSERKVVQSAETEKGAQQTTLIFPEPAIEEAIDIGEKMYIKVPFMDISFCDGYAITHHKISNTELVALKINNPNLREAFNGVQTFIAEWLNQKDVHISFTYKYSDSDKETIEAYSPEINKISDALFKEIPQYNVISNLIERLDDNQSKSVTDIIDDPISGLCDIDEDTFFNTLLTGKKTKHTEHLRYLSKIHSKKITRLRFSKNPISFLFYVGDKNNYHLVWETFEAKLGTYIWSFYDSPHKQEGFKQSVTSIEKTINEICTIGRREYLQSSPDNFRRIIHDYNDSGFLRWKNELNSILDL